MHRYVLQTRMARTQAARPASHSPASLPPTVPTHLLLILLLLHRRLLAHGTQLGGGLLPMVQAGWEPSEHGTMQYVQAWAATLAD